VARGTFLRCESDMAAIHVVVRPRTPHPQRPTLGPLYGLFDVVVDGINVTARIGDTQALGLLADLSLAVADLGLLRRVRATVPLYTKDEAWELGLERDGDQVLMSVYRVGPKAEAAVLERPVGLLALAQGLKESLAPLASDPEPSMVASTVEALRMGQSRLEELMARPLRPAPRRQVRAVTLGPNTPRALGFRVECALRLANKMAEGTDGLERADLHALLCRGSFGVTTRARTLQVPNLPIFLVLERLVELGAEVVEAAQKARPLFRRVEVGKVRFGIRLGAPHTPMSFSLTPVDGGPASGLTFPELSPESFVEGVVSVVQQFADAVLTCDPSQAQNLRLSQLRHAASLLLERTRVEVGAVNLENRDRDRYRPFSGTRESRTSTGRFSQASAMRFLPRWTAAVPNLDPRSISLCGDGFVVCSHAELLMLDRATGDVRWRQPTSRAGTLATPSGVLRVHPDGRLVCHELESGQAQFSLWLVPRAFGGATGAVIHTDGLPKIVAIAEGDRRVTAVDLVSGEIRWRYTAPRPSPMRIRKAGRLLIVGGGDCYLVALDVTTGETVWRLHDKLPYHGELTVEGDELFALTLAAQTRGRLNCVDVWSGKLRWQQEIGGRPQLGQAGLLTAETVGVPLRDGRGSGLCVLRRDTGETLCELAPGTLPRGVGWLALEDVLLANGSDGTLTAIESATGAFRYRHVFPNTCELDQPRQLQPTLREGAIFVPQSQVHVLRGSDGQLLGRVPSDVIADVLRVDDQCGLYLAEESGHLAAFAVAPTLVRVK